MLNITDVKVFKSKYDGKIKANASVEFDGEMIIPDFKIIEGSNGLFVKAPSDKVEDKYKDRIWFRKNSKLKEEIEKSILAAYEKRNNEFTPVENDDELPWG